MEAGNRWTCSGPRESTSANPTRYGPSPPSSTGSFAARRVGGGGGEGGGEREREGGGGGGGRRGVGGVCVEIGSEKIAVIDAESGRDVIIASGYTDKWSRPSWTT